MRRSFNPAFGSLLVLLVAPAVSALVTQSHSEGRKVFLQEGCNECHSISSARIPAKIKTGDRHGGDLTNMKYKPQWLGKYLKKETPKEGKSHTKPFKGSDEELQALVDWLLEQKAEG